MLAGLTNPVDDPIATALRQAQYELREVVAINKARKAPDFERWIRLSGVL